MNENEDSYLIDTGVEIKDTNFGYTLSLIGGKWKMENGKWKMENGKWKMMILYWLFTYPPAIRFNELKRYLGSISFKTLSTTLKELEKDGLVHREEYPQIPPKVEYSLTARGQSLMPVLRAMCEWGRKHKETE
ncbi:TPA: winged helix-turn-helix transcriptional regulator [Pasteurella multocida]|uniref:winged helix-turn-helix transcriptional regulator n=1 Tax=Pasteurella multocida TaxID=747 RepID=UPI0029AE27D5|nr:helix-turn-helix domain-containing protein [Pasteurella multocida]MDX3964790.1 helix-turn-helix domain-containing protein [Pasteurella multocida]